MRRLASVSLAILLCCCASVYGSSANDALSKHYATMLDQVNLVLANETRIGISSTQETELLALQAQLDPGVLSGLEAALSQAKMAKNKAVIKQTASELRNLIRDIQASSLLHILSADQLKALAEIDLRSSSAPGGSTSLGSGTSSGSDGASGGLGTAAAGSLATQPQEPSSGPGGADYSYSSYNETDLGAGDTEVWVFEPTTADSMPQNVPVIVFLHGAEAFDPTLYLDFIKHLVFRGNIVIYPRYQASATSNPLKYTSNAITAVQNALALLQTAGHVTPDLSKFALAGHSYGGVIAANMTVLAQSNNLPKVKATVLMHPGTLLPTFEDYTKIPADTLLLCIVGADDTVVGSGYAKMVFQQATQVPTTNKDFITVNSDTHGIPPLISQHGAPCAPPTDALDWYGYWKWTDALTSAAFFGTYRDYAIGGGQNQTYMGTWSDGVPVVPAAETENP